MFKVCIFNKKKFKKYLLLLPNISSTSFCFMSLCLYFYFHAIYSFRMNERIYRNSRSCLCFFVCLFFFNLNPHLSVLGLVLYWKVFVNVNFNQNLSATLTIVKKKYTKLIVKLFFTLHCIICPNYSSINQLICVR